MPTPSHRKTLFVSTLVLCALGTGCLGNPDDLANAEGVEATRVALSAVPASGVLCINVKAYNAPSMLPTGSALVDVSFSVAAGAPMWSTNLGLGSYTTGTIQLTAKAFGVSCSSISTATPTWIADSTFLMISPGIASTATLQFRANLPIATSANFAPTVAELQLESSSYGYGLRLPDGTVRLFGSVANPTGLTSVAQLGVGYDHACARKTDGTVWCWGGNSNGQLGNGTTTPSPTTPVQVPGITGSTALAVTDLTSCASTATATFCWGRTSDGNNTFNTSPVQMVGFRSDVIAISGSHACALANASNVGYAPLVAYCWGQNGNGGLGNGSTTNSSNAVMVQLNGLVDIAAGFGSTCAVDALGRVWCWGYNANGQLGNGTTTNSSIPVRVGVIPSDATDVAASFGTACARTASSDVYCWGTNNYGQVGDGTGVNKSSPVKVLSGNALKVFGSGASEMCALLNNGSVTCWGSGRWFNDPSTTPRYKPAPFVL